MSDFFLLSISKENSSLELLLEVAVPDLLSLPSFCLV